MKINYGSYYKISITDYGKSKCFSIKHFGRDSNKMMFEKNKLK